MKVYRKELRFEYSEKNKHQLDNVCELLNQVGFCIEIVKDEEVIGEQSNSL